MILYHGGKRRRIARILSSGFKGRDEWSGKECIGVPLTHTYQWFVNPETPDRFDWQVLEVTVDLRSRDLLGTTDYAGFHPDANIYWIPLERLLRANPRVRRVSPSVLNSPRQLEHYEAWQELREHPIDYDRLQVRSHAPTDERRSPGV